MFPVNGLACGSASRVRSFALAGAMRQQGTGLRSASPRRRTFAALSSQRPQQRARLQPQMRCSPVLRMVKRLVALWGLGREAGRRLGKGLVALRSLARAAGAGRWLVAARAAGAGRWLVALWSLDRAAGSEVGAISECSTPGQHFCEHGPRRTCSSKNSVAAVGTAALPGIVIGWAASRTRGSSRTALAGAYVRTYVAGGVGC